MVLMKASAAKALIKWTWWISKNLYVKTYLITSMLWSKTNKTIIVVLFFKYYYLMFGVFNVIILISGSNEQLVYRWMDQPSPKYLV